MTGLHMEKELVIPMSDMILKISDFTLAHFAHSWKKTTGWSFHSKAQMAISRLQSPAQLIKI